MPEDLKKKKYQSERNGSTLTEKALRVNCRKFGGRKKRGLNTRKGGPITVIETSNKERSICARDSFPFWREGEELGGQSQHLTTDRQKKQGATAPPVVKVCLAQKEPGLGRKRRTVGSFPGENGEGEERMFKSRKTRA